MKKLFISIIVLMSVSACGGGGNDVPADTRVGFNGFVVSEINSTSETREAVDVNQTEFIFTENENAFDSVL